MFKRVIALLLAALRLAAIPGFAEDAARPILIDRHNSPEKYALTVGVPNFDLTPVQRSVDLLRGCGIDYEFRTTVVRELHTEQDILSVCQWVKGAPTYALQNFVDSGALISTGLHSPEPVALEGFARLAQPFFNRVIVRGV